MLGTLAVVLAGALLSWGGLSLVRRFEVKPGETRFAHFYSPYELLHALGYMLVCAGLMIAIIAAPMYWISHSR